MSQIFENLYLGSYKDARDQSFLNSQNITHIVTVGAELKTLYPKQFDYLYVPAKDHFRFKLDDYFDEIADYIHKALITDKGNVLVHCQKGVSRSTASVIAYLIKYHDMELSDARSFVKSKRSIIFPNPGFMQQLNKYYAAIIEAKEEIKISNVKESEDLSKNKGSRNSRSVERRHDNEGMRTRFSISLVTKATKNKENNISKSREDNKSQYFCKSCQENIFEKNNIIDYHCKRIHEYSGMIFLHSASWMTNTQGNTLKIFCPNPHCKILLGLKTKNEELPEKMVTDKCGIYSCRVDYVH